MKHLHMTRLLAFALALTLLLGCAACGKEATVPFKPREDRPVYCSECFARMKEER